MQGAEPLEQPLEQETKCLRTSGFNFEACFTGEWQRKQIADT
jgi:hypothetical protein